MRSRQFCRKKPQPLTLGAARLGWSRHSLGKFVEQAFNHSPGLRTYKVHVPNSYRGQAMPLLVMLHGCTQNPDDFAAGTRMNVLSDQDACFIVYPSQPEAANPSKCWNWFNRADQRRGRGEPAIIAGITREVMQTYRIDENRVFVAGLSAGAAMAVVMAATYPELYAAIGAHSGLAYRSAENGLSALDAMRNGAASIQPLGVAGIPVIVFHGEQDRTVNPRNGRQIITQWLESRPDQAQPICTRETGKSNGRTFERTQHRDAHGDLLAEFWLLKDTDHAWSGGSPSGSHADPNGPDASREMLHFFLGKAGPERPGILNRLIRSLKPRMPGQG